MEISGSQFLELYHAVYSKFSKEYEFIYRSEPRKYQVFELPGCDEHGYSLKKAMLKNQDIDDYIQKNGNKFNARYLYDKKNNLEKKFKEGDTETRLSVNSPYDKVFFYYLGYNDLDEYLDKQKQQAVEYTGYYYSYRKHDICTYTLKINYHRKPPFSHVPFPEFTVEEQGYHDHMLNPLYSGYGYILEGKMQLMMWVKQGSDRLRILLDSGDAPQNQSTMRGIMLSISSYQGKPLTANETILVRGGETQEEDELRIRRYLFLHRYNFRIDSRTLNLHQMIAKGYPSDFLRNFVGAWRVFRIYKDTFIPSILYVKEDYHITCFNNNYDLSNFNEQVCLPGISTEVQLQNRNTIILECFPKEGARKISSLMLNIPDANSSITGGVISVVGGGNLYPSTSAVAMMRDEQLFERLQNSSQEGKLAREELNKNGDLEKQINAAEPNPMYNEILERLGEIDKVTVFKMPARFKQQPD